jgi:hypothetical protein
LCISYQNAVINLSKDNAFGTKEDPRIDTALDKTAILKTVAQLGKLIVSCLLEPIKTFVRFENVEFLVLVVWSIKTNRQFHLPTTATSSLRAPRKLPDRITRASRRC